MDNVTVVVLTKFQDIFDQFQKAIDISEPDSKRIVIRTKNGDEPLRLDYPERWTVLDGEEPFIFSRNANKGIVAAGTDDVLLVNDDVQIDRPYSLHNLHNIAHRYPDIGILSPVVDGGVGNELQKYKGVESGVSQILISEERLAFVCVYIKRSTIDKIGLMDERFFGYGGDDVDYSIRTQKAGLNLGVTDRVVIKHGFDKTTATSSFTRTMGSSVNGSGRLMCLLCAQKHSLAVK